MDGTADNGGNNIRQEEPESSATSSTVLAALQLYPLFDMTAYNHGKSTGTTSQCKRIALANASDCSASKKSKISEKTQNSAKAQQNEIKPKTVPGGEKNDSDPSFFAMEQWPVDDFQLFLESVNEELNELGQVNLGKMSDVFQSHLKESMQLKAISDRKLFGLSSTESFFRPGVLFERVGKGGDNVLSDEASCRRSCKLPGH
jgi:hypothetical protein